MGGHHIVFATTGSLGDLHPFVALGRELLARGHRVTIATSRVYASEVASAGLDFHHMRPDPEASAEFHAAFMHPVQGGHFVYAHYLAPAIRLSYEDLLQATRDADMLISQSLMALAAPLVAEVTGIRWLSAVFQPMAFFSIYERPNYLPNRLLQWLCARSPVMHGRVLHYVKAHTRAWVAPVLDLRRELGLQAQGHPMFDAQHAPLGVLAMFSPLFGAPRPDWPPQTRQTGQALNTTNLHAIPADLHAFLQSQRPLVFTLSSAACNDAGNFYSECFKAALALRRPALFITGGLAATAQLPQPLPGWARRTNYAPYALVFPHAAAIVHAGGIATSFEALRAGKPQVVVPYAHDQTDNALRLQNMGVARVIRRTQLTSRRLQQALSEILSHAPMQQKASLLAEQANAENGTKAACDVIESALQNV